MILVNFRGFTIPKKKTTSDSFVVLNNFGYSSFQGVSAWYWMGDGFGERVTTSSMPNAEVYGSSYNTVDKHLAISTAISSNPGKVYTWTATGPGTAFSNPGDWTNSNYYGNSVSFSSNGDYILHAGWGNSPGRYFIIAYDWSTSGYGTKKSDPASMPTYSPGGLVYANFSPNINAVAASIAYEIHAWKWTSGNFGTKYSNPGTQLTNIGYQVELPFFNSNESILVCGPNAYPWSNTTGFGTKLAVPNPARTAAGGTDLHPDENAIATGTSAYQWSNTTGFGTKYSQPSSAPASVNGVKFCEDKNAVFMALPSSPWIAAYAWSYSGGFGTKYSNPSSTANIAGTYAVNSFKFV